MPTNPVSVDKMGIGKKNGGKHWTAAEVEARALAAEGVRRKKTPRLRAPEWLSEEARKVWDRVKRQVRGLELLDHLDTARLAIYCDAVARYRQAVSGLVVLNEDVEEVANDDAIKAAQAWARLVAAYADKLGFTPAARARLVKKKADEILDEFGSEFDG